jgi:soluble lytic murein transglycosylase
MLLFFSGVLSGCAVETVLGVPKKDALSLLKKGDVTFIADAHPSRMTEISKIDAAAPFYAALLLAEQDKDNERNVILLREAVKSPAVREAALKKLSELGHGKPADEPSSVVGDLAAGQAAAARRDYNEALRKFQPALEQEGETFLLNKELLGDLGKAFQYASIPKRGEPARTGAGVFLAWEKETRDGGKLWTLPDEERDERRYLLLYYAARMMRQIAEYAEAEILFTDAFDLAPDSEQSDACIWYILDTAFIADAGKTEKTKDLIKKYLPLMADKTYFLDFFEKYTHFLCLNQHWNDIAELFPYVRSFGAPELRAKYAFILGNIVESGLLPPQRASAALSSPFLENAASEAVAPRPSDFYRIAYDNEIIAGLDVSSFYYAAAAAKKLGKKPRLNIPVEKNVKKPRKKAENPNVLTEKFLSGFFLFGAERLAYPYILENVTELSIPELRSFAESLAKSGRWGESIRLARTYMRRPDYKVSLEDIKICYPFAFSAFVKKYSHETGMDEDLLYGLIRTESLFIPDIVSRAGAVGLMQLMPETARETARQLARLGGPDYFDGDELELSQPGVNIHLGSLYFQQLKTRMDGTLLALLSYNGGMTRIRRWRNARPALNDALFLETVDYAETRDYGRQVIAAAAIYRCLYR